MHRERSQLEAKMGRGWRSYFLGRRGAAAGMLREPDGLAVRRISDFTPPPVQFVGRYSGNAGHFGMCADVF